MTKRTNADTREYLIHADGVTAAQLGDRLQIRIAEPRSAEQVVLLAGALGEVWASMRDRVVSGGLQCELFVHQVDAIPMPLANVFSVIEQDLGQTGRCLHVRNAIDAVGPELKLVQV
ncbi:MAG: hypothetical protein HUU46_10310 [Candidatus Hydrogenedentes bacterium]|nr:hypothetical protein [Candidatus Hydrogenedentota bacterium]